MVQKKEIIYLSIAGFNIKVSFTKTTYLYIKEKIQEGILKFYQGFVLDAKPKKIDYWIKFIDRKDIFIFRKKIITLINLYQEVKTNKIVTYYQISIYQFLLVVRAIVEKLLETRGFILHSSAANIRGKAYLFLGKSGAGKSTVITLLKKEYQSLADDSVIIKKEEGVFYLYQTPFFEKNNWFSKGSKRYFLGKVYFLRKKTFFKIEKIENKKGLLKKIIYQFWTDKEHVKKQLKVILDFVNENNRFYFLHFNKKKKQLINLFSKL